MNPCNFNAPDYNIIDVQVGYRLAAKFDKCIMLSDLTRQTKC